MTTAPRGLSLAGALLLIAGLGSAGVVVLLLGRQVAREREKTVRSQTDQQGLQSRLGAAQRDLKAAREEQGLDNLHLVQGLVQETFPASYPAERRIGLVHLDMDIYEPTVFVQNAAWPLMTKGGYYVYDDATVPACVGATQAVEDLIKQRDLHSEQVWPHFVLRVGL